MRHRPGSPIRSVIKCARCGQRPDLYDVRRALITIAGKVYHLVVCSPCDKLHSSKPAAMEEDAMAIDATDAIASMGFTQRWGADAARVQRTAEHFLGAKLYASHRDRLVQELAALQARHEAEVDRWRWRDVEGL